MELVNFESLISQKNTQQKQFRYQDFADEHLEALKFIFGTEFLNNLCHHTDSNFDLKRFEYVCFHLTELESTEFGLSQLIKRQIISCYGHFI